MENEARHQRRIGVMMEPNRKGLQTRHHGIDVLLSPVYDVHAGRHSVGLVWKDGDKFYGVPTHRQNKLYEGDSLEYTIDRLFEDEGIITALRSGAKS